VYGGTQREVRDKLADLVRRHRGGTLTDAAAERQTLSDFLDAYLEAREGQVRPKTLALYEGDFRLHVAPELGAVRLADLRPHMIQSFLGRLRRAGGLSPRTVGLVHTRLRAALKQAVDWGLLVTNPADKARPPAVPRREGVPPTAGQVRDLLSEALAADDPLYPLWLTGSATGARLGELCALRWRDVALPVDGGMGGVKIERTLLKVVRGEPLFGPPKAEASRRALPLLPAPAAALRALREARRGRADELVFLAPEGGPLDSKTVSRRLRRAWGRTGHGPFVFHSLRHYAGTAMLEAGVEPQTVAAILGHAQVSTTLNMYAARRPERLAPALAALAPGLDGAPPALPGGPR
jgi:integrase